ncbi:MAG: autotransporter outer membrane beta-barrel domain-containing protein [Bacteroidales bacterium]|nr:autotransporter outer membrane beta-barrel domain-containing protein [Bacteroidales bacterium]
MKKALVLLLACLMAVNVSAQKAKTSSSAKKTTTKTTTTKKSTSSKKKSNDGTISKGTIFLNTNATNISFNNFSYGSKNGSSTSSITRFGLQATGGYGLANNLAAVGGLGFQYGKSGDSSLTVFSFNGGVRYYVIPNLYVSGMAVLGTVNIGGADKIDLGDDDDDDSGSGGSGSSGSSSKNSSMKGHSFGVDLGVGYSWFLTPRIAIEPNISYSIGISNKVEDAEFKLNSLTFNIGFTILL